MAMTADEIKLHQDVAKGFEQNITQLTTKLRNARTQYQAWQLDKVAIAADVDPEDVQIGSHKCEDSPIGICAYGEDGDDFCLFCDGPDERK